jgi:hypothetical protein
MDTHKVKETHYGVISDIHNDPNIIPLAIETLTKLGAQKFIINGDLGSNHRKIDDSHEYIGFILNCFAQSNKETYVQPGSHETVLGYKPVIDLFADKYSNIIDVIKEPIIKNANHNLLFIPGSDFHAGNGEFSFGKSENIPSGLYIGTEDGLMVYESMDQYVQLIKSNIATGLVSHKNLNDYNNKVSEPEKTLAVCHVPRKFSSIENCVDMAYYVQAKSGKIIPGIIYEQIFKEQIGDVTQEVFYKISRENGFIINHANRGNEDLKELYSDLGITKAINGHFHESGHRANDLSGNKVEQNKMVTDLFWNSGHLDRGQTGILTISEEKASYMNVNLTDYLN